MVLDNLYLELTRNCTMECEHCLRGNREQKNIDFVTLNNIFKETKKINNLLLSGGEPLINLDAIEFISLLIKKYNVNISRIGIITNGTIISDRHIEALNKLKKCCNRFDFVLSNDLFHKLEWKRLKIENRVEENYKKYSNLFGMTKYPLDESFHNVILTAKGKARSLTKSRINEITRNNYIHYKFIETEKNDNLFYVDNQIYGKICVDVKGNIVDYNMSFCEEDNFSKDELNVNQNSFDEVVKSYIDYNNNSYSLKRKL